MSKRKWIELCKTLGIFLLMLSAVFLAVRAFFIPGLTGKSFDYLTSEWFSLVKGYDQDSEQEENQVAALPIRIVAISSERKQCIQYNTDMLEAVFRQVSGQLGEALKTAEEPEKITGERFQAAIQKGGYYFEWMEPVSLPLLCTWLNENIGNNVLSHTARRILVGAEEGVLWLYYINDEDDLYYACRTKCLKEGFGKEDFHFFSTADTVQFLFETSEDTSLDPYLVCMNHLITLPVLERENPLAGKEDMTRLLEAWGYNERTMSNYQVEDGRVFKQNEDTFRFTANGEVSYSGNGLKKFFISNSGTAVTQAEVIEAAHQMIKQTVGPLYGNSSSFYLEKLEQTEKNKYHLTFGCQVEGVPVFFSNGTHAVEIQISGTNISAFKVQLRQYNLSGDTRTLVPERQAMKALSSQEGQLRSLFVGYVDDGSGTVTPEWLARQ